VSNSANRDVEANSILRYVQSSNTIQDCDVVPAIGVKINELFSIGVGINFSYAKFDLQPITGFAGSNIADSQSDNQSDGRGVGAQAGFLVKPAKSTVIGFDYRSVTTYQLSGTSIFNGNPRVVSNNYHFKLATPARAIFSVNHFLTSSFGLIGTIQHIQWSFLQNIHVNGIAAVIGTRPVIVNGTVPYRLHDAWLVTLGTHYRATPKWIIRVAGTYNQSPGNPQNQIVNGDSIVLGISTGYDINKTITLNGSYAHVFIRNETININSPRFLVNGINSGSRDGVSVKLTINV